MKGEFEKRISLVMRHLRHLGIESPYTEGSLNEAIDEARKEFLQLKAESASIWEYHQWFEKWFGNEKKTSS